MKYFLLAILFTIVFFADIRRGYSQCTGCSQTVNVSGTTSTNITAAANGQILCITGTGTYTGTININWKSNVTLCLGSGVTLSSTSIVTNVDGTTIMNNYGTWNNSLNNSAGIYQSGVVYNNYGTVNTDNIYLTTNTLNNYGTLNVSGSIVVNKKGVFNTYPGSAITVGGDLTVNGGVVSLGGVMTVIGSVTNNGTIQGNGGGGGCSGLSVGGSFTNNGVGDILTNGGLSLNKPPSPNYGNVQSSVIISNSNPTITTQPVNAYACPGSNASFTVASTPAGNTYQWQVQAGGSGPFTTITGQTGSTLTLSGVTTSMNGNNYRAVIYACPNSVVSNTATLTVNLSGIIASTNVNCNGAATGTISISSPMGGGGTYQYSINGGGTWQSSGNFTGLTAGVYNVRIRDAANTSCVTTLDAAYSITQPTLLTATINKTNVLCNGASTGAISITSPTGGVSPYQYSINGGAFQSSGSFTNLAAGVYTVNMKDANNCIVALSNQTISQPTALSAAFIKVNVLCNGASTGSLNVFPSGGNAPYQYSINGGAYQSSGLFSGLAAGTYTLNLKDLNNCVVSLPSQTITESALLSATVTKTNVLCNGASTGSISITSATGGVPRYEYSLNGGGYQSSGNYTGLSAGTNTLNIKDANNCIVALPSQTITEPALLSAS
ncbi:MAG: hypothetical protein J7604_26155, partial [Sporocytophaga sp.]|uniref:beta strand repeat-containing protein n=1 Tax=Sporocytophaga sp. TaxID=2231183 RepID=UPI001B2D91E6|nr:hypothetical protein [Sporocytophaga sp.]